MSARPALVRRSLVTLALLGLASCGLLKKGGGAGDAAADADTTAAVDAGAAPTVTASNDADLTHPADEAKVDPPEDAKIEAWSAVAKTAPGSGTTVATLAKGTAISKIGTQADKFVLVMFDSPKDATKKVAGWIPADALTAHTVIVRKTDGGVKDGGVVVVTVDAGVQPMPTVAPTVAPTAAPTVAPPAAGTVEVAPTNGACPASFLLGSDGRCHKNCAASPALCGGARCTSKCGTSMPVCVTPMSSCAK